MVRILTPASPAFRMLDPLYQRKIRRRQSGVGAVAALHPGIPSAFDAIERITGTSYRYIAKARDLIAILETVQPRSIAEMGSGRTSIVFGAWAAANGCDYLAFEQDERWAALINAQLACLDLRSAVDIVPTRIVPGKGGRFVRDIPSGVDMIYVDAPAVDKSQPYDTFTRKPAYFDAVDYLRRGERPRAIVIDGRTDTVDELLKVADGYRFRGDYLWAKQRNRLRHGLAMRRHSLFLRR